MKMKTLVLPVLLGLSLLMAAGCSFDTDQLLTFQVTVTPSTVIGGSATNGTAQASAGAVFTESGAVVVDPTEISWTSSNTSVAAPLNTGLIYTSVVGSTTSVTITGYWPAEGETATTTLTVTP